MGIRNLIKFKITGQKKWNEYFLFTEQEREKKCKNLMSLKLPMIKNYNGCNTE